MTTWKEIKLGEIADITMGQSPKSEYYNDKGLGTPFMQGNRTFGFKFPTFDTYTTVITKLAYPNDIIMSVRAPVGALNITPMTMCLGRGLCSLRSKGNNNQTFLYYLLKHYSNDLISKETGTVFGSVSYNDIANLYVRIPEDIDVQKKIAGVLSALDDKIELNNQINSNLEQQAQALFKSWFIDFEPFGGKMPNDWEPANVEKAIVLHDSQRIPLSSNQRMNMEKRYPYYGATSIMDFVDNYIFDGKFLLLAEDGTVIDKNDRPVLQYVYGKFWANNHAHVISGKNGFSVEFLYLFFKQTNIKGFVTGAVQPKINQANLKSIPINIPTKNILSEFDVIIQPLFNLFIKNNNENQRLSEIRDSLLPKLISGEIDMSKVDISGLI